MFNKQHLPMKNKKTFNRTVKTVSMPESLAQKVKKAAQAENRSVSNYIETVLQNKIERVEVAK